MKRSLIVRLPFKITETLGLNFSNFNPRACTWVDRVYAEKFLDLFPPSLQSFSPRLRKLLLRVFRVKVLCEKTLLVEEGGTNTEVFIILRGTIKVYRRLPGQKVIAVKDKKPIVTTSDESAVADFSSK